MALLFLLSLTISASAAETIFARNYLVPKPFGGTETVQVRVIDTNDDLIARVAPGNSAVISVYTRTEATLTLTKHEESGGYAHGIAYRLDDDEPEFVLFSYSGNGSVVFDGIPANATLKIQLYRINVVVRQYIDPEYWFMTSNDTTGPAISLAPEPGAYQGATVVATPVDAGAGMASDLDAVTTYAVRRTSSRELVASGTGTRVVLDEEGTFDLSFAASDLLGNQGSSPGAGDDPNTYTIDHSPPVLSDAVASAAPRQDGFLDVALRFTLNDAGVGVASSTMQVEVSDEGGSSWAFAADDLAIVTGPGGSVTVSLPVLIVPRSARLHLDVAAQDTVGNVLDLVDTPYVLTDHPDALSASVLSSGVSAEAVLRGTVLIPRYRVPIAIDRPRDEVQSAPVARYRIIRRIESSGSVEVAADLAPDVFVSRLVEEDGHWVYWDTLEDDGYAHQSFTYQIETVFSITGSETTAVTGVAALPNIEAWQVELFSGTTSLQTYRSVVTKYPEVLISSFEGVTAGIGPDPEGDALAMRLEYFGPGGITGTVPAGGWAQEIALDEVIPGAPDGTFRIRYVISETGNAELQTSPVCTITVDRNCNTIAGPIVWGEDMVMSGSIIILDGGSLLVKAGVRVTVAQAGSLTVTVRPGGALELESRCVFEPMFWQPDQLPGNGWEYWGGIIADESAGGRIARVSVSGTIRGAVRGVTAASGSDVTIQGASIEQCRTGVHAIGVDADPVIEGTEFIANARYGIKEDLGAAPVVTDCEFASNTCDYYDEVLTVVGAEGINDLPGNSGNTSTEASP